MKKIITTIALLTAAFTAYTQDGGEAKKPRLAFGHELGIETNNLVARLLNNDDKALPDNPYLLTYKLSAGDWAVRTGIGGHREKSVEREDGFADSRTELSARIDLRLGLERRLPLGKKWVGSLAIDGNYFSGQEKSIDDSGFDVITVSGTENGWGVGPAFGLRFDVTERLSLYTEGFAYYNFGTVENARTFKNFPEFDDQLSKVEGEKLKVSLPSVLYLVFRF